MVGNRTMGLCIDGRGIIKWQVIPCHWHMRIYSIFYRDDKNRMWIGTFGGGLNWRFHEKTGMFS